MIECVYIVICNDEEKIRGMEGFFQISINGNTYGEIYSKELESIMHKVSIYDWFERLLRVIKMLQKQNYIVLSDTESYNRWIEFINNKDIITVSIISSEKIIGSKDIEYMCPRNKQYVEWDSQEISYTDLKEEIVKKSLQYLQVLLDENNGFMSLEILKLKKLIIEVQSNN